MFQILFVPGFCPDPKLTEIPATLSLWILMWKELCRQLRFGMSWELRFQSHRNSTSNKVLALQNPPGSWFLPNKLPLGRSSLLLLMSSKWCELPQPGGGIKCREWCPNIVESMARRHSPFVPATLENTPGSWFLPNKLPLGGNILLPLISSKWYELPQSGGGVSVGNGVPIQ